MADVVVVGSLNLDLVVGVPRLPGAGETVLGSDVVYRPGGKGANQAVAAQRLGADTMLYAAIGSDQFGKVALDALSAEGLTLDHVGMVESASTGIALVVVDTDGENTVVVAPGANSHLRPERLGDLDAVLTQRSVLLLQLEVPFDTVISAAQTAREIGATVVLNAAPLPAEPAVLSPQLLQCVDVLVVNQSEAGQLAGLAPAAGPDGWVGLAQELSLLGPRAVVVTLGRHGAVAVGAGEPVASPAFEIDVVDATGAGDSFCGALAVALQRGGDLREAVQWGCAAGGLATTKFGAQDAMPTPDELSALLNRGPGAEPAW